MTHFKAPFLKNWINFKSYIDIFSFSRYELSSNYHKFNILNAIAITQTHYSKEVFQVCDGHAEKISSSKVLKL